MELDELKNLWKKSDVSFPQKGEAELATMLRGQSKSVVDKLKRSVWFEMIFTLIAGLILLVYSFTLANGALKWTCVSILVVFVAYTFYYIKKLMLLNKFNSLNENLKVSLESLISSLTGFLKFYKRSYTILYPVYFCVALMFVAIERGIENFIDVLMKPKTLIFLFVVAGIFYLSSTWLVNWFLKKLYGNHLEKLKAMLAEINAVEKAEII
jgi:cation transport ATPase